MQRWRQAQICYQSERNAAARFQYELGQLGTDLAQHQSRAADAAARHASIRRQIGQERDRIGAITAEIVQLESRPTSGGDDVEQMSSRVRSLTADLNQLVAHDALCKTMIANARRSLQQFQQQIAPLRRDTVRLGADIQAGHRAARAAAQRLARMAATLAEAVVLGRQLKSCDDRWTRAIVQAEAVLDQYGADLVAYDERLRDLGETHRRTCALIEAQRGGVLDRRSATPPDDIRKHLRDWRRVRRRARQELGQVEGQFGQERACLQRIRQEIGVMQDETIPSMNERVKELERSMSERKAALDRCRTDYEISANGRESQREQQLMLIEDHRSRRELMIAQRQKSAASRDRYLAMIEQETRSIRHWAERGEQLDQEIERGKSVVRHEKDQQAAIVSRDAERQRQRTQMLARLTAAGAELSQAREQIDEVSQQIQQAKITSNATVANLVRARAAAQADLEQVQRQHDQLQRRQQHDRQRALERIQLQRDRVQIESDQMKQRRDTLFGALIDRARAIRQAEFVHRKLRYELDEHGWALRVERRAIDAVIEERLLAGRKSLQAAGEVDSKRASMDHAVAEIGRQLLSLHLRSHAAVQHAETNARLRDAIREAVRESGPVDFAIAQYLAVAQNRAVVATEATQTSLSVSHVEIQTEEIY